MNWTEAFKGIQLCLGFQLLILAIFLLSSRQKRNALLGAYTVLISLSSLSSAFYDYLEKEPLFNFLIGAHLVIFHAPLLFLYIKSLEDKSIQMRKHFVFPVIYTLAYLVVKLFYANFFSDYNFGILISHLLLCAVFTVVYFKWGSRYFDLKLNDNLKQKALLKFRLFYVVTNLHAILLYSVMSITYISYLYFYDELRYFNESVAPNLFSAIVYIHPLTSIIFIIYLLSETHSLQSLILDKRITKSYSRINPKVIIDNVHQIIDKEKKFTDPEFNIQKLSSEIGLGSKELAEFFNEELNTSFSDFLHRKRIDEFKRLLQLDLEQSYSLEGIALLAGFKSKATFYRIFKKMEGITPSKYNEKLKSSIELIVEK